MARFPAGFGEHLFGSCISGVSRFLFFGRVLVLVFRACRSWGFFRTLVRIVFFGRVGFFVFRACRPVAVFPNICSQLGFRACRHSGFSGVLFPFTGSQETLRKLSGNSQEDPSNLSGLDLV